jgi:NRAMP (natural resistance-associated macrophage protein)-like metal ion transporter
VVQHAHSPNTPDSKPVAPDVHGVALHPADQSWMKKLGPGIITGAADDDPSGIATYSQAGARFGYGLLWTIVLTYPLMAAIQMVSAHIGQVTGHGLATNIRRHYPTWLLYTIVGLLLVANTINIAADIAAMADATHLLLGGVSFLYVLFYGVLSVVLQVLIPYVRYVRILKWLTFALLAYLATVFVVQIPLGEVLAGTFIPRFSMNAAAITMIVAVFGTTISPYLFFWQASQEVEEQHADPIGKPLKRAKSRLARAILLDVDLDTYVGMAFSNLVAFFIVLTTAATLHAHGVANIESSAQAAAALRPIAGEFAYLLFTLGIVGTGLLAVPVLAGSAAYAMAGTFRWRNSLELKPTAAKKFYGVIALATLMGAALNFVPLDPIKALFWSAVMNGVIAVPVMVVMMLLVSRRDVMGRFVPSRRLRTMGWASTAVMAAAVSAMLWSMVAG